MTPSILVVDDDRATCAIAARILRGRGYTVEVAPDGPTALEMASRMRFNLALIDYQMPGMNGVELFRRMRRIQPAIIGVFLTAYATINTVFPAIEAGIERVLAKPLDANELLPIVEELAGTRFDLELPPELGPGVGHGAERPNAV